MKVSTINQRPEIWLFVLAILTANLTLLVGRVCEPLVYFPAQTLSGDWWRMVTYPLVHVSAYHLLLDAGAFLFLYYGLQTASVWKRLLYVAGCTAGSLAVSLSAESLCGLSGIAHGLMAISSLEMMERSDSGSKYAGATCFGLVIIKSVYEALSGHVAFEFLHLGSVGHAVAVCHAGGVLGGLLVYALLRRGNHFEENKDATYTNA